MPYIDPEVVREAKQVDLLTYLENYEPNELVRVAGNVYSTRTHDSLKISNGKWMWWSHDIGGKSALDYLIKVRGMAFTEAVEQIMGWAALRPPVCISSPKEVPKAPFSLPAPDWDNAEVERYLAKRGISPALIGHCIDAQLIYQTKNKGYANAVFVGIDSKGTPRYATLRGTRGSFKGDVRGSDKRYSFALPGAGRHLHLFESAIDLLSFATLEGATAPGTSDGSLLSLSGVYRPKDNIAESTLPPALTQYLNDHPDIQNICLHLDRDLAGRLATRAIMAVLPKEYTATDEPPPEGCKDLNDYLCERLGISKAQTKDREAVR
jgi:hypothetical protein